MKLHSWRIFVPNNLSKSNMIPFVVKQVDSLSGDISEMITALRKLTERMPPFLESMPVDKDIRSDRCGNRKGDPRSDDPALLSVSMRTEAAPSDPDTSSQSPARIAHP